MTLEASYINDDPTAPDDARGVVQSPVYVPVSDLWWEKKEAVAAGVHNATAAGVHNAQDEVVFGPGVQLQAPHGSQGDPTDEVREISDLVTRMDIDTATERGPATAMVMTESPRAPPEGHGEGSQQQPNLYTGLFRELSAPILQAPTAPPPCSTMPRERKAKKPPVSTRSSVRLAARPSSVPVAHRAQHKLMRELSFIDSSQQQAPDAAVTEYLDLYADDLPEQAIKAIQAAARLGNKKLAKILKAVVQEADALEMEA